MSTREEKIKLDVAGAQQSARDLDRVGDAAAGAGRSVEGMGRDADKASRQVDDLGDEAKGTASDLSRLDRQIVETRAALAALNTEFERTGDAKASAELDKQVAALAKLETRAKSVAKINKQIADEGRRAAKRQIEDAERIERIATRGRRGVLRNTLGDLFGLGVGAVGGAARGAAGVIGDIPGGKLALGAVGVSAAPAIGASIGGATLAGAGLAGIGLGIAGAVANNPEPFKKAWAQAIEEISNRWQHASVGFEKPALAAFATIKKAVDGIDMEGPLKAAQQFVEPLARGVAGFITPFAEGLGNLIEKAGPVIGVLAKDLPVLGKAFEEAFNDIGGSADGAAMALDDIIAVVGTAIIAVGKFAAVSADVYKWSQEHLPDILGGGDVKIQSFGRALDGASASTGTFAGSTARAADEVKALNTQFDELFGRTMNTREAAIAYEQAVDDLTASFKKNGDSIDLNIQKGRDNALAIDDVIKKAQISRDAAIAAGDGSAAATDRANAAYQRAIDALEAQLVKLGLTREEARGLLAVYREMDGLTITTNFVNRHVDEYLKDRPGVSLGNIMHHEGGGSVSRSGWSIVGERGPEIAWLSQGQYVSTAQQTRSLLGAGGGMGGGDVRHIIDLRLNGTTIRELVVTGAADRGQSVAQFLGVG